MCICVGAVECLNCIQALFYGGDSQHGEANATGIITFPKRRGHSMQGHKGEAQGLFKSQGTRGKQSLETNAFSM